MTVNIPRLSAVMPALFKASPELTKAMTLFVNDYAFTGDKKKDEAIKKNRIDWDRPWGGYETTNVGQLPKELGGFVYTEKTIKVNPFPDGELSVQMHMFREEIWKVKEGELEVYLGDRYDTTEETIANAKKIIVKAGETLHIPAGKVHFLKNATDKKVIFEELQFGVWLSEQDNFRFPTFKDQRATEALKFLAIINAYIETGLPEILGTQWTDVYKDFNEATIKKYALNKKFLSPPNPSKKVDDVKAVLVLNQ